MPSTLAHTTLVSLFLFNILFAGPGVQAMTSYANDFVDPDYVLARGFPDSTHNAQVSIADWAAELAAEGPWTVMNKSVVPPTGNKHDYMSWAPYSWPDCSSVGNTTELAPEQVWKTCPYVTRDGLFNPDGRLINDVGSFQNFSDAVLYNAIAWAIDNQPSSLYSQTAVTFIKTWFLNNDTMMNPNLDYAQMARGPNGQVGQHTGVLDLKGLTKIVSGIIILRKGKCTDWTTDLDNQMNAWTKTYITWLETASIAIEEGKSGNNHGSFYYNQLAALKILVNDIAGAQNVTGTYFATLFKAQISANGEQPLEAARTRPYHYRAYNLAAMITNARLDKFANGNSTVWNTTSSSGATIQNALDFAMTISASTSSEDSYAAELYPSIAAVAAIYGDPQGKYAGFLKQADGVYPSEAYFLWNQPLSDSGLTGTVSSGTGKNGQAQSTGTANQNSSARSGASGGSGLALVLSTLVALGLQSAFGC